MAGNWSKWLLLAVVCLATELQAQSPQDAQTYCTYVMEQAQAERDLLRTPTASGGLTQPEEGLPVQIVGGASLGLSAVKKAGLTMDVARGNCDLYQATAAAQQEVQYAAAALEKSALRNRLTLIDQAQTQLDALMDKTRKMIEAQNATRMMLFALQSTKIRLDADRADTQSKIAALYTPALSDKPLKQLVADKQNREVTEQLAQDKLDRQNNWDVSLQVGVHQQVNPVVGAQPYGSISISYNLGSRAIDRHLDKAADAYGDWKKVQEGDVVRNVEVLRQQLTENIAADEAKLKSLEQQNGEIDANLAAVASPDTSAALDFNNQLTAAKLLLQIERGDANYRLANLREFLAKNY